MNRVLLCATYLALVVVAYVYGLTPLLSILTIPWSLALIVFGWLIVHATVDGERLITAGKLLGALLNIAIYLVVSSRSRPRT